MSTTVNDEQEREAALATCRLLHPSRYLSDPEVMDNPEIKKLVEAEWEAYFQCYREVDAKYPIKGLMARSTDTNQPKSTKVTPDTTAD